MTCLAEVSDKLPSLVTYAIVNAAFAAAVLFLWRISTERAQLLLLLLVVIIAVLGCTWVFAPDPLAGAIDQESPAYRQLAALSFGVPAAALLGIAIVSRCRRSEHNHPPRR